MKPPKPKQLEKLDDFIFENRNQSYGAYYIRNSYNASIRKAISLCISVCLILLLLVSHFAFNTKTELPDKDVVILSPFELPNSSETKMEPAATKVKKPIPAKNSYTMVEKIKNEITKEIQAKVSNPTALNNKEGNDTASNTSGKKTGTKAEEPKENYKTTDGKTYTWVDSMPEFAGGDLALSRYIRMNFHVPDNIDGNHIKVRIRFTIDEKGSVTEITIPDSKGSAIDHEAIRVLQNMPQWKPGKMAGKPVKVSYIIPININIY